MFNSTPTFPGIEFGGVCLLSCCVDGLLETPRWLTTPRPYGNGPSVLAQSEIRRLTYATSCRTCGLHSLDGRLAIEHPFGPPHIHCTGTHIIDPGLAIIHCVPPFLDAEQRKARYERGCWLSRGGQSLLEPHRLAYLTHLVTGYGLALRNVPSSLVLLMPFWRASRACGSPRVEGCRIAMTEDLGLSGHVWVSLLQVFAAFAGG